MAEATRALLAELVGGVCRCGANKHPRQTFCRACYYRLPSWQRSALYRLFGEGYEEAYREAVATLDATAVSS
jgi:ribosomal protein L40E